MSDLPIPPSSAAIEAAYGKARQVRTEDSQSTEQVQTFSTILESVAQQAVETVRTGDEMATAGLAGQVSMQSVVEATMAMDSTVRVSVALRDKLVEAYREIIRMPI